MTSEYLARIFFSDSIIFTEYKLYIYDSKKKRYHQEIVMLLTSVGTHPIPKRSPGSPQIPFMEVIFKLSSGDVFNVCTLLDIKKSPTVLCGGYNVQ